MTDMHSSVVLSARCELSIVTPVFNRVDEILKSVESSLMFLREVGGGGEIVVVDDASSDGSVEAVVEKFAEAVSNGVIRILRLRQNIGPTGAKQAGAESAFGAWLIFMDSDDSFVAGSGGALLGALRAAPSICPVVFFRCVNKSDGKLIGSVEDSMREIGLRSYLHHGTPGECLPVVRRECLLKVPYEADLRGFEQITYAGLIRKFGAARVMPITARVYCADEGGDRLSTRRAVRRRGCQIARGYFRMLLRFGAQLRWKALSTAVRLAYHGLNCIFYRQLHR